MLEREVPQAIRWQYGGGIAVAVACVTVTGLVHESLDPAGSTMLGQKGRAALRLSVALIFALLPLVKRINDLQFLGAYVGIFSLMALIETWAKLGREAHETEDHTMVEDVDAEEEPPRDPIQPVHQLERAEQASVGSSAELVK